MTNITIINPRTAWNSDPGIFYTICLIFILYNLLAELKKTPEN